ncbi:MAG: ABC transporter permease [Caldilineales bacterium]|nr:ABC transporter permease [Caldilineales bacterium]
MTTQNTSSSKQSNRFVGWLRSIDPQILGLVIALAVLLIFFAIRIPEQFYRITNIISIGEGITLIGLTGLAETVVMIMGGLDIAIGSLVGLCSAAAGVAMLGIDNAAVGIGAALIAGLLGGLINGVIITKGKLNPVVVTLGTYTAYRGIALLITPGGYAVNVRNETFNKLGTADLFGIPSSVFILILAAIVFFLMMGYAIVGRNIFAIGGNAKQARLVGIGIDRYQIGVYVLAGLMAGVAAIVLTSRTKSGQPISGSEGLELQAITAAILGGVSMRGGKGSIVGTMLGVLIIGTLNNGMILMSVPTFYQRVARGLLLVIAALIQIWQMRRAEAARKAKKHTATAPATGGV